MNDFAPRTIQTVDELSLSIKNVINASSFLRNIAVRGEIQNFKKHSSGHVYFTLMGEESRINAVLFRSHTAAIISWPRDGDEVMAAGSVDVYAKGGTYQLYATRIMPIGLGAQKRAREELKAALEREGLFDVRHKRPLPKYPSKVAVVTSPTGAALRDILEVSLKRAPFVDIVLIPATVQGADAPSQVIGALALAGAMRGVDCVILARGGGARDDLSPFDDERIVRAVRSCPLPVVTGVGHQIDTSLADLAADAALPTPSAAAERVFPDSGEILQKLSGARDLIASYSLSGGDRFAALLDNRTDRLVRAVGEYLSEGELALDAAFREIGRSCGASFERNESLLASAAAALDALSPLAVLSRGYSICRNSLGQVVKSADKISPGDRVTIQFHEGSAEAEISTTAY
jgi:exodeoxyribonuclease VII large subunit